jgi:hypothetical protein
VLISESWSGVQQLWKSCNGVKRHVWIDPNQPRFKSRIPLQLSVSLGSLKDNVSCIAIISPSVGVSRTT